MQDFTWQQGTLLDQIEARQGDAAQYLKRSREVQNEQQQVYTLARIENQIVDDLRDRLNELKSGNDDGMLVETHIRYLENLKKTSDENIRALDDWPSTITLRQTIDELLEIGMVKNKMPDTMRDYGADCPRERRVDSGGDAAGAAAGVGAESLFHPIAAGETLYRAEPGGGADWFRPDGCHHSGLWPG